MVLPPLMENAQAGGGSGGSGSGGGGGGGLPCTSTT